MATSADRREVSASWRPPSFSHAPDRPAQGTSTPWKREYALNNTSCQHGGGRRVGAVVVQARERALKGGPAAGPAMRRSVATRAVTNGPIVLSPRAAFSDEHGGTILGSLAFEWRRSPCPRSRGFCRRVGGGLLNAHDADRMGQLCGQTTASWKPPGHVRLEGRDAVVAYAMDWLDAFPDARMTVRQRIVGDPWVVDQFSFEGTHDATLHGPGRTDRRDRPPTRWQGYGSLSCSERPRRRVPPIRSSAGAHTTRADAGTVDRLSQRVAASQSGRSACWGARAGGDPTDGPVGTGP